MRKELGLKEKRIKRREREVEGGNIKKKKRKRIRACNVVLCLLHCALSIVLTVNIRQFPHSYTASPKLGTALSWPGKM